MIGVVGSSVLPTVKVFVADGLTIQNKKKNELQTQPTLGHHCKQNIIQKVIF